MPPLQHRVDHRLDVVVQKVVERVAMEQAETRGEGVAREHRLRDGVGLRTQEDGERVHRLDPHQAQRRSHHAPRRALPGRVVVHVEERHESREELHARRERLGRRLANGGLRPADFRREKRLHRLRRTGGAFRVHDGDGDVEDVHQGTRVRAVVRGDGGPNLHALVRLHVHARAAARVRIAAVRGPPRRGATSRDRRAFASTPRSRVSSPERSARRARCPPAPPPRSRAESSRRGWRRRLGPRRRRRRARREAGRAGSSPPTTRWRRRRPWRSSASPPCASPRVRPRRRGEVKPPPPRASPRDPRATPRTRVAIGKTQSSRRVVSPRRIPPSC